MRIKITKIDGTIWEVEGSISYNESYVEFRYAPEGGDLWCDIVIPWHRVDKLEMRP